MNYQECIDRLNELKKTWNDNPNNYHQLDCNFVAVSFPKSVNWRIAKAAGAVNKQDGWGWVLWSGSTQDNGSNFAIEVRSIAWEYDLVSRERQL